MGLSHSSVPSIEMHFSGTYAKVDTFLKPRHLCSSAVLMACFLLCHLITKCILHGKESEIKKNSCWILRNQQTQKQNINKNSVITKKKKKKTTGK